MNIYFGMQVPDMLTSNKGGFMGKIYVVGLGPGDVNSLTLGAVERINSGLKNFVRTKEHPTISYFLDNNIPFESFDYLYEKGDNFEELYSSIANKLYQECIIEDINYFVPGNPMVAEKTVQELVARDIQIEIISGMSFIEPIIENLEIDIINGLKILNGETLTYRDLDINSNTIITQVYNRRLLTEMKLALSEVYGDEYTIYLIHSAGIKKDEKINTLPVYELDRTNFIGPLSSVFVPKMREIHKKVFDFNDILCIIEMLRGINGCPWDIEQTHQSLRTQMLEEAYEACLAIDEEEYDSLSEELGDVLLQVVFHSEIARESGEFNIYNVTTQLAQKMIERHPHVFGEEVISDSHLQTINWEILKYNKRGLNSLSEKLEDIRGLPALINAKKVQEKASMAGFDWKEIDPVYDKIVEELRELEISEDFESRELEMGDLLFSVVNLSRFLKIDPEIALMLSIKKFKNRIQYIEDKLNKKNKVFEDASLQELENLWEESKDFGIL